MKSPPVRKRRVGAVLIHDREAIAALDLRDPIRKRRRCGCRNSPSRRSDARRSRRRSSGPSGASFPAWSRRQADHLLFAENIPEAEVDFAAGRRGAARLAGDEALRVDDAPIAEARDGAEVRDFLDERARIERQKQARAFEVAADDARDLRRRLLVARVGAQEFGDRDRDRLDDALGQIDLKRRVSGRRERRERQSANAKSARDSRFVPIVFIFILVSFIPFNSQPSRAGRN